MPGHVSVGGREVWGAWEFVEQNETSKAGGFGGGWIKDQLSLPSKIENSSSGLVAHAWKSSTPKAKAVWLFSSRPA